MGRGRPEIAALFFFSERAQLAGRLTGAAIYRVLPTKCEGWSTVRPIGGTRCAGLFMVPATNMSALPCVRELPNHVPLQEVRGIPHHVGSIEM